MSNLSLVNMDAVASRIWQFWSGPKLPLVECLVAIFCIPSVILPVINWALYDADRLTQFLMWAVLVIFMHTFGVHKMPVVKLSAILNVTLMYTWGVLAYEPWGMQWGERPDGWDGCFDDLLRLWFLVSVPALFLIVVDGLKTTNLALTLAGAVSRKGFANGFRLVFPELSSQQQPADSNEQGGDGSSGSDSESSDDEFLDTDSLDCRPLSDLEDEQCADATVSQAPAGQECQPPSPHQSPPRHPPSSYRSSSPSRSSSPRRSITPGTLNLRYFGKRKQMPITGTQAELEKLNASVDRLTSYVKTAFGTLGDQISSLESKVDGIIRRKDAQLAESDDKVTQLQTEVQDLRRQLDEPAQELRQRNLRLEREVLNLLIRQRVLEALREQDALQAQRDIVALSNQLEETTSTSPRASAALQEPVRPEEVALIIEKEPVCTAEEVSLEKEPVVMTVDTQSQTTEEQQKTEVTAVVPGTGAEEPCLEMTNKVLDRLDQEEDELLLASQPVTAMATVEDPTPISTPQLQAVASPSQPAAIELQSGVGEITVGAESTVVSLPQEQNESQAHDTPQREVVHQSDPMIFSYEEDITMGEIQAANVLTDIPIRASSPSPAVVEADPMLEDSASIHSHESIEWEETQPAGDQRMWEESSIGNGEEDIELPDRPDDTVTGPFLNGSPNTEMTDVFVLPQALPTSFVPPQDFLDSFARLQVTRASYEESPVPVAVSQDLDAILEESDPELEDGYGCPPGTEQETAVPERVLEDLGPKIDTKPETEAREAPVDAGPQQVVDCAEVEEPSVDNFNVPNTSEPGVMAPVHADDLDPLDILEKDLHIISKGPETREPLPSAAPEDDAAEPVLSATSEAEAQLLADYEMLLPLVAATAADSDNELDVDAQLETDLYAAFDEIEQGGFILPAVPNLPATLGTAPVPSLFKQFEDPSSVAFSFGESTTPADQATAFSGADTTGASATKLVARMAGETSRPKAVDTAYYDDDNVPLSDGKILVLPETPRLATAEEMARRKTSQMPRRSKPSK
ncbi:unnamed protein product [Clonostachys byssicola]|uniref:Uncharacterized protein n=1 Tax=Clonostachys byssicola TaxID=160290 RepID=A0A9N9ULC8_9HYPO|nr:unnamed protein product [Clonostachys byssicola]